MTKQVAEELEKNKRERKYEIVAVHKKNVTCGETYVNVEIDGEGNVLTSNSEVNILLPSDDDKSKENRKNKYLFLFYIFFYFCCSLVEVSCIIS